MSNVRVIGFAALVIVGFMSGCAQSPEKRRDAFLAKGREQLDKGNYTRALLEFRNASKAVPKDAEPYYYAGMAAYRAGDLRSAVLSFRKTLELNPKHTDAKLRLAQMMTAGDEPLPERGRTKHQ